MQTRRADNRAITVSGPGLEPRRCPSVGAAVNFAQRRAEEAATASTFYVRAEETALYWIERQQDGVILTREATTTTRGEAA